MSTIIRTRSPYFIRTPEETDATLGYFVIRITIREGLINAGLYHLKIDLFLDFFNTKSFSLESDVFPIAAKNGFLKAKKVNTDFIDIGIPEDYFRFCNWINTDKKNELWFKKIYYYWEEDNQAGFNEDWW